MLHGLAVLRSRTCDPISIYSWIWSIQVKQVSGRGLDGPGHYSLGVGAWVGTLTKHGHKEVLHLASYVGAEVPHLNPYYLGRSVWRRGLGLLQIRLLVGVVAGRNSRSLPFNRLRIADS